MLLAIVKGADHLLSVLLLPLAILDQTRKWLEGLRGALFLLLRWFALVSLAGRVVPSTRRCDSTGGRGWELGDLGCRSGLRQVVV